MGVCRPSCRAEREHLAVVVDEYPFAGFGEVRHVHVDEEPHGR